MVMAMEAWARFSTASSRFIHIADSHMQSINIALASPKDVILFFSYSGSTKDMEDIMNIAKDRNVPIILVTHFPKSRAAEFADVILLCKSRTALFNRMPVLRLLQTQSGIICSRKVCNRKGDYAEAAVEPDREGLFLPCTRSVLSPCVFYLT